ncbi:MAG: hypothetical protein ACJ75J_09075, partial [Cytophagaceae bacterium]
MKKIKLLCAVFMGMLSFAQAQDANVSLSNISSNNGYTGYSNGTISGIYFEVLSDGNNSNNIISDFEVSLYLLPCNASGSTTGSNPIVIKTYSITNMQQLHSIDYDHESVDLNTVSGLSDGTYRMGVWVNSNIGVPQPPDDGSDNASLVTLNSNGSAPQSVINFSASSGTTAVTGGLQKSGINFPNPVSKDQLVDILNNSNLSAA